MSSALRFSIEDAPWAARAIVHADAFDGVVVPDLRRSDAERGAGDRDRWRARDGTTRTTSTSASGGTTEAVARAIARAAMGGTNPSILCVSGDGGAMDSSAEVLGRLRDARERGRLPRETTLLAAANPMLGATEAERVMRKRESGADGIITQPALLLGRFERWWEACERLGAFDGLGESARESGAAKGLILGVAPIRDVRGLELWFKLTDVDGDADADARALRDEYAANAASMSPERFDDWTFERFELATTHAASLDHVAGVHVMPITPGGYAHAARLARDVLPMFRR